jgi:hypothetical protein
MFHDSTIQLVMLFISSYLQDFGRKTFEPCEITFLMVCNFSGSEGDWAC